MKLKIKKMRSIFCFAKALKSIESFTIKNKKGTTTYLSDILGAISSLFLVLMLLFISALIIFVVKINIITQVFGTISYEDSMSEYTFMSFLETTNKDYRIRDLFTYFVWKGNPEFELNGEKYNMTKISGNFLKNTVKESSALVLEMENKKTEIAKLGAVNPDKAVLTEYVIQAGEKTGILKFWSEK